MWWKKSLHKDIGTCKLQTVFLWLSSHLSLVFYSKQVFLWFTEIESKWCIQWAHVYSVFIHPLKWSDDIWNISNWSQLVTYGLKWQNYMPREVRISFHYFSQVKSVWPRRDMIIINIETWASGRKRKDQADSKKRKSSGRGARTAGNRTALRREPAAVV